MKKPMVRELELRANLTSGGREGRRRGPGERPVTCPFQDEWVRTGPLPDPAPRTCL